MLPIKTKTEIVNKLKHRKLEDVEFIKNVENELIRKRGYIYRKPLKGDSVVLLLSGGLDSVTCWGILMKEFGLNVYPLSFDRGEKRAKREKASIDYYSKLYKERFPALYHKPVRLTLGLDNVKIPIEKSLEIIHPEVILDKFKGDSWLIDINVSMGAFLLLPVYAKIYAESLKLKENLDVRNIFCSVTLGDGRLVPHQTFTSLRSVMLYLCSSSGDYSWQFTSAVFEKELGLYLDKSDLVKWACKNNIPLDKTWSCYHAKRYQCGGSDCITCVARKNAFMTARAKDTTKYIPVSEQTLLKIAKHKLKEILGIA